MPLPLPVSDRFASVSSARDLRRISWGIRVLLLMLALGLPVPVGAQTTWYFQGTLTDVVDVFGNAADDPAFASGFYALGTEVDGWVTLDPAQASPDYDLDEPLNLMGPDDPQRGFYLGAVSDFSFRIRSRVELDDAFTFRSTLESPFLRAGSVLLGDDIAFGPVFGDQYTIFLPSLFDEVVFMPPAGLVVHDRNGWQPVSGTSDRVLANLSVNEFVFQAQPQLLVGDELDADLERAPNPGFFNVTYVQNGVGAHELRLTFTLAHLGRTPVPEPAGAPAIVAAMLGLSAAARIRRERRVSCADGADRVASKTI